MAGDSDDQARSVSMSHINAVGGLASSSTLREFVNQTIRRSEPRGGLVVEDRLEISELAGLLSRLAELPEVRARRIVAVRSEIDNGTYVTDEKLSAATDRLMAHL